MKHLPGRRMVLRETGPAPTPTIYWKLYHEGRGERPLVIHRELDELSRSGRLGFRVPELIGSWTEPHAIALGEVQGQPLSELPPPALGAAAEATGVALATLHRSRWRPARAWRIGDEAAVVARACARLAAVLGTGVRARTLAARIVREWTATSLAEVALHRDFHPGQVLCGTCPHVAVVDWDDAAYGPAVIDVANFTGHLRLEALRRPESDGVWAAAEARFLRGYASVGIVPRDAVLRSFTAGTLLRLAGVALERRADREEASRLVQLGEAALSAPDRIPIPSPVRTTAPTARRAQTVRR